MALVWLAVASPVPVTVTLAVAVAVDVAVAGTYCTTIVHVLWGAKTKPATQVPPLLPVTIENVPLAVPAVWVMVGLAGVVLKVNAAAVAPLAVFATVMVLVSVAVLAGVGFSAGKGAEIATVAPVTWNAPVKVAVEIGVVTFTFLAASPAPAGIAQLALTVVAVLVTPVQVIVPVPPPVRVTPLAFSRLVPVRVTATVVPRTPVFGLMLVSVDPWTVNVMALLVPPPVATLTFLAVSAAVLLMLNVADICSGL